MQLKVSPPHATVIKMDVKYLCENGIKSLWNCLL